MFAIESLYKLYINVLLYNREAGVHTISLRH